MCCNIAYVAEVLKYNYVVGSEGAATVLRRDGRHLAGSKDSWEESPALGS
jgi:hypothetical protein